MAHVSAITDARSAWHTMRRDRAARPPRTPLLVRAARLAGRYLPTLRQVRTFTLSVAGFACLTAAAWMLAVPAGLAVGGLSLFAFDYLCGGGK